ncbi:GDSL-type esterase/lipase family protein [Mucilaginibacter aquatilis]|uniref:GDSL family lipase n=1 Tax=Mucilaginibacter aquatilis TaxID=1517760 RepID=A0A6I4IBT6_9SPHI|nr:GDSL-type esterase/lipase family protein [Mucilaginibacter aquatilis]MVN92720.1 GDSL family lipase [Mucilaginibacter aquatilis]
MKKIFTGFVLLSLLLTNVLKAQPKPAFWDDIQAIKRYDRIYLPPQKPILFIGSSSVRYWSGLSKAYPDRTVLNRSFGGSRINDVLRYADEIVFPYQPSQIVIYVGENDVPDQRLTADSILNRFKELYTIIRSKLPQVPIVYISMKPSPSRAKYVGKLIEANKQIETFISTQASIKFLDVYSLMLDARGNMRPQLYKEDKLHMTAAGYKIWERALEPLLIRSKE